MANHLQTKQWMRTEDAARYMHHSPKTLEKWRVYGTGPTYVKMGRVVLYDREAIDYFLQAHSRHSTVEYMTSPGSQGNSGEIV